VPGATNVAFSSRSFQPCRPRPTPAALRSGRVAACSILAPQHETTMRASGSPRAVTAAANGLLLHNPGPRRTAVGAVGVRLLAPTNPSHQGLCSAAACAMVAPASRSARAVEAVNRSSSKGSTPPGRHADKDCPRLLTPAHGHPPQLRGASGETGHDCCVVRRFVVAPAPRGKERLWLLQHNRSSCRLYEPALGTRQCVRAWSNRQPFVK
jgi:hypothetical protein